MALDYRQAVRTYRKVWHTIDLRSAEVAEWGGFYLEAREWIVSVAHEHGLSEEDVASIVALTSPRMPWGRNKQVTLRIVAALAQSGDVRSLSRLDVKVLLDGIDRLGITHERRRAVAAWIADRWWNDKALKVTAFRENLLGRLDHVTIDTWMAKPFGLDKLTPAQYRILARACRAVAAEAYTSPAVVQAILWGYFRQGSGWARHDGFDQITLEVA